MVSIGSDQSNGPIKLYRIPPVLSPSNRSSRCSPNGRLCKRPFIDTIVCINTYAVRIQMAWTHDDAFDVWCSTDTIELIFELVFELIFELILELILKLSWYRSSGWAVQLIIERKLWFQRNRNYQALWQFGEPSLTEFTLNFRAKCKCLEKNCEHFAGR